MSLFVVVVVNEASSTEPSRLLLQLSPLRLHVLLIHLPRRNKR
jgi:hypothetical protein